MRYSTLILTSALATALVLASGCDGSNSANAKPEATNSGTDISAAPDAATVGTTTVTVTATETQTETQIQITTATVTATATVSSTATVTSTVSSVTTVTQIEIQTVTETSTETEKDRLIARGTYVSDTCFLNLLASEGIGEKVYTRTTMQFGKRGHAENSFELFADADCSKSLMQNSLSVRYSVTKHFDQLLLLKIGQYNDPEDKKSYTEYWIPALTTKEGLLFDIDGNQGSRPFTSEPSEEELKKVLDGMEKRGVLFRKK